LCRRYQKKNTKGGRRIRKLTIGPTQEIKTPIARTRYIGKSDEKSAVNFKGQKKKKRGLDRRECFGTTLLRANKKGVKGSNK